MKPLLLLLLLFANYEHLSASSTSIKRLDGTTLASSEIDATVTRLMRAAEVTGVGIAIFNQGKIAYLKTYGFRDVESKLPLTENSVFTGASLTKSAFAYLVMQLVQEKKIDLDTPITRYLPNPLPQYPAYRDLAGDPRSSRITARMLLSHTSGFPNSRQENKDLKLNINFEPGSRYAYSGEGIQLLQFVVETIMHTPLQDLMRERVFLPLGMNRTSMVSEARFADDLANGYDEWGRSLGPQQRKQAFAAGSLQTTVHDFANFMQAVMQSKGLQKSTRDLMLSPQVEILSRRQFPTLDPATTQDNKKIQLSYGLGWGIYQSPYGNAFFKEGHSDEGVRNYTVIFDRPKTGILIMTNSSNGEGIFQELLETLLRDTFTPIEWEGFTPWNHLPPRAPLKTHTQISVDPEILDRYVGRYTVSGVIVTISRQGNRIFYQEGEEPKVEIFAESPRQFFSKVADDVLTFQTDPQGRATSIVLHTGGREIPIQRVP